MSPATEDNLFPQVVLCGDPGESWVLQLLAKEPYSRPPPGPSTPGGVFYGPGRSLWDPLSWGGFSRGRG